MHDKLIQVAEEAVRRYLEAHPQAADTVEGIHLYWIDWGGAPESIQVTEAALLKLEESGFVTRIQIGNRDLWRRSRPSGTSD